METGHRNKTSSGNPHSHLQLVPRRPKSTSDATRGPKLRSIFSAISPARHFCRLSAVFLPSSPRLGNSPLPDSGEVLEEILGTGAKHHDSCRRPCPPGRRRGNSLAPPPSLCMFQKRELSSSPDLSRSGCAVYLNSLKPETVLACRDSCSQDICLQQSVARMASCFYSRISYVLRTPFASITHSPSNSSY